MATLRTHLADAAQHQQPGIAWRPAAHLKRVDKLRHQRLRRFLRQPTVRPRTATHGAHGIVDENVRHASRAFQAAGG